MQTVAGWALGRAGNAAKSWRWQMNPMKLPRGSPPVLWNLSIAVAECTMSRLGWPRLHRRGLEALGYLAAQDLAGRVRRQFVAEHNAVGGWREPRKLLRTCSRNSSGSGRRSRLGNDNGNDHLAPLRVLGADHRNVVHVGVFDQHVLEFGRCDVLAAADDGVVGPTADEQKPLLVNGGHILGREPALFVEDRTDAGVFARNLLATDKELTYLARSEHFAALVANLHLDTRHRVTDGAEPFGGQPGRTHGGRRDGRRE